MVYRVGDMLLQETQELFRGKVNDVIVCQDMAAISRSFYTVLVIRNHDIARRLLEISEKAGGKLGTGYVNGFSWKENYLLIYDYQVERPIEQFFSATVQKAEDCERVCTNIILECLTAEEPYPLLYLQLVQHQINLSQDGNVSLGYNLDLAELSEAKTEQDCASLCAKKLFLLLEQVGAVNSTSYLLLEMKNQREGYTKFLDLYREMHAATLSMEKVGPGARAKSLFKRHQGKLTKLLFTVCIILAVLALLMITSQLIFGDIPFLRLFVNSFKKIGTESLLN